VAAVVDHLRDQGHTSKIGIWGQSMGAVTALLYANRDPSIAGIVLDSPFSSLNKLMMELVDKFTAGRGQIPLFTDTLFCGIWSKHQMQLMTGSIWST
jgi:alpha-beta hydrolase superfamily lysophospholipase